MFASNKTADIMKGMGIGIAVGTAATFASTMMMSKSGRRTCKKKNLKTFRRRATAYCNCKKFII